MPRRSGSIDVYLELGQKRGFAVALEWPGWARSGKDEAAALQALCDYGPRYARALRAARLGFEPPADPSAFIVVERLKGTATTDFGSPGVSPAADAKPLSPAELGRAQTILRACWRAFDAAARAAVGRELRKGPRGGGRSLDAILEHVLGADEAYLGQLGWPFTRDDPADVAGEIGRSRQAMLVGLAAATRGEIPARGPRGGLRWTPRYFIRRVAWHTLDHAWEIEDRRI